MSYPKAGSKVDGQYAKDNQRLDFFHYQTITTSQHIILFSMKKASNSETP